MFRKELGWDSYFEAQWQEYKRDAYVPARVVSEQRGLWRVAGDFAERWAAPSGKLRRETGEGGAWPAVGDWVAAEMAASEDRAVIHGVLPRRSQFSRKVPGRTVEQQVIAANVDTALIVMALDGNFNLRRLERYLAQCWDSGAKAVVVLNKADACGDVAPRVGEVERVARGVPVLAVSARTGLGLEAAQAYLPPGQTIVLLGSSGVGKSTLLNRWLGREAQRVRTVREKDSRGRHSTTSRQLFVLPCGAVVIDTPGLRELQLWGAEEGVARAFGDIETLAARCRFRDCGHTTEPGCAVQAALASGELDAGRLENRRKLGREQEFLRRKIDPQARQQEKHKNRVVHRAARKMYQQRKREGGK
jgi:ribosome biogenesis GTPase / thiamine phosphate phosphatase